MSVARVALVSARPMFHRTFGKLLGTLRPTLEPLSLTGVEALSTAWTSRATGAPEDGSTLVLLDAGRDTTEMLARRVGDCLRGCGAANGVVGDGSSGGVADRPGDGPNDDVRRDVRVVPVLDEPDDAAVAAAMAAGAAGALLKATPPGALAEWLGAILDGEIVRPAPRVTLDADALPPGLRARLSARRQKLLRLVLGGASVATVARELGMTSAKVVSETRLVMDIVRGGGGDGPAT